MRDVMSPLGPEKGKCLGKKEDDLVLGNAWLSHHQQQHLTPLPLEYLVNQQADWKYLDPVRRLQFRHQSPRHHSRPDVRFNLAHCITVFTLTEG
ncbi:hypothetical protein Pmani_015290 [Petrolisthes manimaculis]|uniref:Uncharacterized protein n=1 Tax=Petrolisthes manimaculis TaxID=1843537 RepID=A0AAE1UBS4_9EUCA|nr:hypothetical protein Pmani_015290 [Petrolisthes manimaculis]